MADISIIIKLKGQIDYMHDALKSVFELLLIMDKVVFVSEGCRREEFEKLIKRFSLDEIVILKLFCKNPMILLRGADVFVSSSLNEGFPLVIGEVLCLGVPLLEAKNAGSKEILTNEEYGILVEQDVEELYQTLKVVMKNGELRVDLHNKALQGTMQFDVSKAMEQIYGFYQ